MYNPIHELSYFFTIFIMAYEMINDLYVDD